MATGSPYGFNQGITRSNAQAPPAFSHSSWTNQDELGYLASPVGSTPRNPSVTETSYQQSPGQTYAQQLYASATVTREGEGVRSSIFVDHSALYQRRTTSGPTSPQVRTDARTLPAMRTVSSRPLPQPMTGRPESMVSSIMPTHHINPTRGQSTSASVPPNARTSGAPFAGIGSYYGSTQMRSSQTDSAPLTNTSFSPPEDPQSHALSEQLGQLSSPPVNPWPPQKPSHIEQPSSPSNHARHVPSPSEVSSSPRLSRASTYSTTSGQPSIGLSPNDGVAQAPRAPRSVLKKKPHGAPFVPQEIYALPPPTQTPMQTDEFSPESLYAQHSNSPFSISPAPSQAPSRNGRPHTHWQPSHEPPPYVPTVSETTGLSPVSSSDGIKEAETPAYGFDAYAQQFPPPQKMNPNAPSTRPMNPTSYAPSTHSSLDLFPDQGALPNHTNKGFKTLSRKLKKASNPTGPGKSRLT